MRASAPGWPYDRGIQTLKEIAFLNMREAAAASSLSKLWSDTFLTNAGIDAVNSSQYTYRGAADYDVQVTPSSKVKLLLHGNGANGTNNIADSGYYAKTITAGGNAQHSTAQKKFGTASILFDGTGDDLSVPHSADWDFGAGEFTLDLFARFNALPTAGNAMTFISQYSAADYAFAFFVNNDGANYNLCFQMTVDGSTVLSDVVCPVTLAINTWYHFALVREGNNLHYFLDGVKVKTSAMTQTIWDSGQALQVGALGALSYFNGYMDEVRITKGLARWSANFTPPDSEVSDEQNQTAIPAVIQSIRALGLAENVTSVMMFVDVALNGGTATYYISTDDGANWTEATPDQLTNVPAGAQIRIRVVLTGAAELESWGVAA